jgi:hypothetical protein
MVGSHSPRTLLTSVVALTFMCARTWASPGGCDPAIPNPGADQVFSALSGLEVVGLYKTLWSFRARQQSGNGPIVDRLVINGHSVEVSTTTGGCTNLGTASAWDRAWSCAIAVSGRFALKKLGYAAIVRGGDGVSSTTKFNPADLSNTDTIRFDETLNFDWDVGARRLTVSTTYPDSGARNHQRTWGVYAIRARSLARVPVPSGFEGAVGAMTGSAFPLYANAGAVQSGSTSIVDAHLSGHPFWADRGLLTFKREPPGNETESYFAIEMVWGTNAWMDLSAAAVPEGPPCGGSNAMTISLSGLGLQSGISTFTPADAAFPLAFQSDGTQQTACVPYAVPLVDKLQFHAADAFAPSCDSGGCPGETVGARFLATLRILDQQNGTCERWYDVGSTLLVNWGLNLQTPSGATGGGFDIGSGTAVHDWASPRHFDATYACP